MRFLRAALRRRTVRRVSAGCYFAIAIVTAVFLLVNPGNRAEARRTAPLQVTRQARTADPIWIVERRESETVYSNGLQIRDDYLTQSVTRAYRTFTREGFRISDVKQQPAGIVFHTTESLLVPLETQRNPSLLRNRGELLTYVRNGQLYNFVIDRFGQVFRVVPETMTAHHAGRSVWADDASVYVDLNESFIGIAFEARTETSSTPNTAQIRSARALTDMLRAQFQIPEANCVTHAQVSVNPDNMRIGAHTDWAANFPFREVGLSGGYSLPIAAIEIFGFDYDPHFLEAIGGWPWQGIVAAETHLEHEALARAKPPGAYRQFLQQQYRTLRSRYHGPTENRDRA